MKSIQVNQGFVSFDQNLDFAIKDHCEWSTFALGLVRLESQPGFEVWFNTFNATAFWSQECAYSSSGYP